MYRSPGPSRLAISCQTGRICNGRSVELGPEDARSSNGDFPAVNKERAAAHGREIASFPLVDAIDSQRRIGMAKSKRHAVTVLLTEEHLRKMIDDYLLKEEDIGDRVKVARIVQKLLNGALDLLDKPWHNWDDWAKGLE